MHYQRWRKAGGQTSQPQRERSCRIDGCETPAYKTGLCNVHYLRIKRHGDPDAMKLRRGRIPCAVDGCRKPRKTMEWCGKHYERWKKHGDPLVTMLPRGDEIPVCKFDRCENRSKSLGWCVKHYTRYKKYGDPAITKYQRVQGPCSVDGCDEPTLARDMCIAHYARNRKFGDPHALTRVLALREVLGEIREAVGECVIWTGPLNDRGYGLGPRNRLAHRAIFELEVGPIPEGLTLDHLCRVRACVNPAHLEPVTRSVNTRRMQLAHWEIKARGEMTPEQWVGFWKDVEVHEVAA
ncbi:HNH endonuclease signature motif containing protein [Nonomuraea recticatena]|uniref:HNH nuclease domain-containing protein n=1 Tax=Nonomuraea recticatena TaxID=46178 RepID=A0ABP6FVA5_9ACTN